MAGYEKPDFWTLKAKKEGYPARSVYKLEEIVAKFGLIKSTGTRILDIGAAPGSWSLWILRKLQGRGWLAAVDIQDLGVSPKDENFRFIKGSILDEAVRSELRTLGPYSLVVSDAAPSTTGNRLVDQARSEELVDSVMTLGLEVLAPGGSLVMKIFQGGEEKRLLTELRSRFTQARGFKPESCRSISFETYLVATGFKG
ncbi:MAG: 23S rRNA (uridine2552-2'-O)-methyltransferase [Spirochaetes bacterium]|nr:MAG: 23S rRNA (uridine2552-2'-O)-methyltransferase [Spirochaetota bacterium]